MWCRSAVWYVRTSQPIELADSAVPVAGWPPLEKCGTLDG